LWLGPDVTHLFTNIAVIERGQLLALKFKLRGVLGHLSTGRVACLLRILVGTFVFSAKVD